MKLIYNLLPMFYECLFSIFLFFLIGKNLKGLQNLIESKADFVISGDEDFLVLSQIGETIVLNFSDPKILK